MSDDDDPDDDPYSFARACRIEAAYPRVTAYDLPMDEFEARLEQAVEHEQRARGDADPLDHHLRAVEKMVRRMARPKRRRKRTPKNG